MIYTPQILVTVNYAALGIDASNFSPERAIKIWPSLTNDLRTILQTTQPITMTLNSNVIGSVHTTLRNVVTNRDDAVLGLGSVSLPYSFLL